MDEMDDPGCPCYQGLNFKVAYKFDVFYFNPALYARPGTCVCVCVCVCVVCVYVILHRSMYGGC